MLPNDNTAAARRNGYVYFIETEDGQFIKIGFSVRVLSRLSQLGTLRLSGYKLRVIGTMPGTLATERWLHDRFAGQRDAGEWFRSTTDLRQFVGLVIDPGRPNGAPVVSSDPAWPPEDRAHFGGAEPIENPPHLTEEEIRRLFVAIESVRDTAIFRLIYHRGLRSGEVQLIQAGDWNTVENSLWVRRLKGSVSRRYGLLPVEFAAIRDWFRVRGIAQGALFKSRSHLPISREMIFKLTRQYFAKAGLPIELAYPNALRHSCGMHLMARLGDVFSVKEWMGHKNIANTMKYVSTSMAASPRALGDWGQA